MFEALTKIQTELIAPKNKYNKFGNYSFRSCEDILEAVKPLIKKHKCTLKLNDKIIQIGDRYYLEATATIYDEKHTETATALAREPETVKGMSESQITGTASSYARKYALNALFLIDDTKDADTDEYKNENDARKENYKEQEKPAENANQPITDAQKQTLTQFAESVGSKLDDILYFYGLKSINDMTKEIYEDVIAKLKKKKEDKK